MEEEKGGSVTTPSEVPSNFSAVVAPMVSSFSLKIARSMGLVTCMQ